MVTIAAITLNYTQLLMNVSEGNGTVEFLRIDKQGDTELPQRITFTGGESMAVEGQGTLTVVIIIIINIIIYILEMTYCNSPCEPDPDHLFPISD